MIDAFIHPVAQATETALDDLSRLDWPAWIAATVADMDRCGVQASGVCVMDATILDRPQHLAQLREAIDSKRFWFSLMPRMTDTSSSVRDQVARAADCGFRGLTFHSYLQRIAAEQYDTVVEYALAAERCSLYTGLCTAYGSKRIYDYVSLPLAAKCADAVEGPVILYHAGGARVLEAMLLCEMWPNMYLETSFTLPYWLGSSIEMDLAFSMRRLGAGRVMFGSDAPFVPLEQAVAAHQQFFGANHFTLEAQRAVMGDTARSVFGFSSKS